MDEFFEDDWEQDVLKELQVRQVIADLLTSIGFLEEFSEGMTKREFKLYRLYHFGVIPQNLKDISKSMKRLQRLLPRYFIARCSKNLKPYKEGKHIKRPLDTLSNFKLYLGLGKALERVHGDLIWSPIWQAVMVRLNGFKEDILTLMSKMEVR